VCKQHLDNVQNMDIGAVYLCKILVSNFIRILTSFVENMTKTF